MLRLLIPIALLAVALLAIVGAERPAPRADFTLINRGDVTTLDFQQMSWNQDLRVARLIGEGLVANDVFSHDYTIVPAVAERFEISPDGRTYTFHLRDARWSDGHPVEPRDFLYAWMRALLPDVAADYSGFVQHIKGGRAFSAWRTLALADFARAHPGESDPAAARELWDQTRKAFADLVSIRTPDSRTIVVELERPTPFFLDMVAFPGFFPVREDVVRRYELLDPATGRIKWNAAWTKPPNLVTNGPFEVESWKFKRDLRLQRNPYYWNPSVVSIDSISIPSVEDSVSSVMAFETGAADWVSDVLAPFRAELVARKRAFYAEHRAEYEKLKAQGLDPIEIDRRLPPDPRNNIHVFPAFGTYFWNFNCSRTLPDGRANPLADPRVRRALALATDKRAIAEGIRRVGEQPAATLIPPSSIGNYRSPAGLGFDPDKARELLAEAGYPGGKGFITLDLLITKDGGHELVAQTLAKDWERILGINTTITVQEIKVFRERLKNKNYMTARASWFGDYGDPTSFLDVSRTDDGNNDRAYSNPRFDALLEKAAKETDPDARLRSLEEAERILVEDDLPFLPILFYVNMYLFDATKLTGISSHPRGAQLLYRVDLFNDGKGTDKPLALPPRKPGEHPHQTHDGEPGS
ncbi:MAG: peptide ABC transporter substrate-binding protein [Planctomycetes bacterium]|nr:peptide ABC transporter substrate-binding protein [Planctomycetota bacterium]